MRRTNAKIVGGILVLSVILVAVAYAAISNTELNINGTGKAEGNQNNFVVEFIGTPTTSGNGEITATIDEKVKTKGKMNVTKLTTRGEKATAKYTVKNKSTELSANLKAEATITNEKYFGIECSLEKTTLKAQEETILTVTVTLLKTPIDETKEDVTADITATITAEPKQPESENSGGTTGGGGTAGGSTAGTYVPSGFTEIDGGIQDSAGNQYVWIEVPKNAEVYPTAGLNITEFTNAEYTAIETDLHTYTKDYREEKCVDEYSEKMSGDGVFILTSEQYYALKKKMLKSIYQNEGFYIGKYETGIEDSPRLDYSEKTEIPVIKANAYPYNFVSCNQAQELASNMESGNYTTSLMFGVQWDLVLKYLENKGMSQENLKTDSTQFGNYSNNLWNVTNQNSKYTVGYYANWTSGAYGAKKEDEEYILLSTGASDEFFQKGIYDLAGNVSEWTLEMFMTEDESARCFIPRSGSYFYDGNVQPISNHMVYFGLGYKHEYLGFRVALY